MRGESATTSGDASAAIRRLADARVYDLGREISEDIPNHPNHVPVQHRLSKFHGDAVDAHGMSAANDFVTMGLHMGTHIDGLGHVAVDGCLVGGVRADEVGDRLHGFRDGFGIENLAPIVMPAVVVDVPAAADVDRLPDDHLVSAEALRSMLDAQGVVAPQDGALLFRTGWGREWPHVRPNFHAAPGPGVAAVEWALDQGVRLFGSDTMVFEHHGPDGLPVHRLLIVERGVHIMEALDLEEVCAEKVWEFVLIVTPLKVRGGTGSPVRPVALVPN